MTEPKSADALVPPDFVVEAYRRDLPSDLERPLQLLFALRGCVQRVNSDLTKWLGADALSPGRMQMLMVLKAKDGVVLQRDLVAALGISRASVSELLEGLAREGLVVARPDETHGRRQLIVLTKAGRAASERLIRDNATRLAELFSGLDADEQAAMIGLLERLCGGWRAG